jgi:hypothetical protein
VYIVAQRVTSPAGQSGINAFLFLHGDQQIPGMSWNAPDIELIADTHPGMLLLQRVENATGDNDVVSYLDIAAHDSIGLKRLAQITLQISAPSSFSATWLSGPIAIRFSSQPSGDPGSEFEELRRHAALLLLETDNPDLSGPSNKPFSIIAQDMAGVGIVYQLDSESTARLVQRGVPSVNAKLRVAYENLDELKRIWGDEAYHAQVALVLTGLSQDSLQEAGGYQIHHVPETGVTVDNSPQASRLAVSRDIPGQISGDWIDRADPNAKRSGWPTGALLRSSDGERALDLVFVESAWFPMSEAALYTYQHSAALQAGERWCFLTRGTNEAFEIAIGPSLTKQQVAEQYGSEASSRCRSDSKTVQLLLKRLPRS